jgi:hypothetical protein
MKKKDRTKLVGATLGEEVRSYEFFKMPAISGVRFIHEYGSIVLMNMEKIKEAFSVFKNEDKKTKNGDEKTSGLLPILELLPSILTFQRLAELAKVLLADGKVDGQDIDSDGMCDLFGEDPLELYAAIFWALTINYPKYFGPLLEALEEGADENDTTQDS